MVIFAVLGDEVQSSPVKGPRADVAHPRAKEPLTQFVAGLAGEGHGQDLVGSDLFVGHAPLNSQC